MNFRSCFAPLALIAGLVLCTGTTPVSAQETTSTATAEKKGRAGKERPLPNLFKAANAVSDLTGEQSDKLKQLQADHSKQTKKLRDAGKEATADKEDLQKKQNALQRKTRKQIEEVLTEDQKKEFAEALKKAGPRSRDGAAKKDKETTGTATE